MVVGLFSQHRQFADSVKNQENKMKRSILFIFLFVAVFTNFGVANAATTATATHDVTITVPIVYDLKITSGNVALNAGNSFNATSTYTLEHNDPGNIKIVGQVTGTVGTTLGVGLKANMAAPGAGTSAGLVELFNIVTGATAVPVDMVTAIPAASYLAGYNIGYLANYDITSTPGVVTLTVSYTALP